MKTVILTTVIEVFATASVFAQGTIHFDGSTAHVYGPDGTTPLGAGGFGQLLGGPGSSAPESSLIPAINSPSTFSGGQIASFNATFNNIAPDAPSASFEMVAWDNSSGLYPTWAQASVAWENHIIAAGRSPEVTLANLGGIPPPVLFPVPVSFKIDFIPEPSAAILLGLGAAASLYVGRRK